LEALPGSELALETALPAGESIDPGLDGVLPTPELVQGQAGREPIVEQSLERDGLLWRRRRRVRLAQRWRARPPHQDLAGDEIMPVRDQVDPDAYRVAQHALDGVSSRVDDGFDRFDEDARATVSR